MFPIIKTQKLMLLLLTNISFATREKNNLKLGQKFQNSKLIIIDQNTEMKAKKNR